MTSSSLRRETSSFSMFYHQITNQSKPKSPPTPHSPNRRKNLTPWDTPERTLDLHYSQNFNYLVIIFFLVVLRCNISYNLNIRILLGYLIFWMKSKNLDKNTLYQTLIIIVTTTTVKNLEALSCLFALDFYRTTRKQLSYNERTYQFSSKLTKKDF